VYCSPNPAPIQNAVRHSSSSLKKIPTPECEKGIARRNSGPEEVKKQKKPELENRMKFVSIDRAKAETSSVKH